jgi:hypothetical protein
MVEYKLLIGAAKPKMTQDRENLVQAARFLASVKLAQSIPNSAYDNGEGLSGDWPGVGKRLAKLHRQMGIAVSSNGDYTFGEARKEGLTLPR